MYKRILESMHVYSSKMQDESNILNTIYIFLENSILVSLIMLVSIWREGLSLNGSSWLSRGKILEHALTMSAQHPLK